MVNVTVTGNMVELVNDPLILPDPLAAIPVTMPPVRLPLSLVQLYMVPGGFPLNTIVEMGDPLHIACVKGVATANGIGFTTTVAVIGEPVQVIPPLV